MHGSPFPQPSPLGGWQTLEDYVYPAFGSLPVHAIYVALVMKAVEPIWTVKPETAGRVRGRIEAVLVWAAARGAKAGRPLSHGAMLRVLEAMGRNDLSVHGFRSTFRDWAAECTNFPRDVCEAALAHAVENKAEAAYRRGDLFEKRRQLMAAWATYCAATTIDAGVVALSAGR